MPINQYTVSYTHLDVYKRQYEHLADYVNILRGTNDSPAFSRGGNVPAVTMPHGFNFWVPSNTSVDGRGRNTYTYQANGNYFRHMTISHEASRCV